MAPVVDGLDDLVEIGRGGFGVVYRARQTGLGRDVAVKVLPDVRADTDAYGRFARECEALAALGEHPNIVTVHSSGLTADGAGYLAMSLLPGGSLADRVAAGPSDWREVAAWGTALCGALESAHRVGITHRDIKPENVLFDAVDAPVLVDFGIAGVPGAFRTATGAVTLTLAHAAPEVVAGGRGGVPADVYSLASTVYAALAGRAAFAAEGSASEESLVPMVARIATAPVPDLRPTGVPSSVCAVLERAMSKDPADRQASAEELGVALRAAAEHEGVVVPAAAVVTGAFVAGAAGIRAVPTGPVPAASDPTITGWTPEPAAAAVPLAAPTAVVPGPSSPDPRRGTNAWALVAGAAVVLLGLVAWRGLDAQGQATSGASPSGSPSSPSASADASRSVSPAPSPSATPSATSSARSTPQPTPAATTPRAATPSSAPTSPAASAAPIAPSVPRSVRVSSPQVATSGGSAQVSLALGFTAPAGGAQGYDVRWTVVGGSSSGASTSVAWTSALQGRVTVPVPASGTFYRWQVRARTGSLTSGWVTARIVMPDVIDKRAASVRPALRAQGLPSTTYAVTTSVASSVGHVLQQSTKAGSTVGAGTTVALGVGRAS